LLVPRSVRLPVRRDWRACEPPSAGQPRQTCRPRLSGRRRRSRPLDHQPVLADRHAAHRGHPAEHDQPERPALHLRQQLRLAGPPPAGPAARSPPGRSPCSRAT